MAVDHMNLDRIEKAFIYVLGSCESLIQKGLIKRDDGAAKLTNQGMSIFYQLRDEGFKPTPEELAVVVEIIRADREDS